MFNKLFRLFKILTGNVLENPYEGKIVWGHTNSLYNAYHYHYTLLLLIGSYGLNVEVDRSRPHPWSEDLLCELSDYFNVYYSEESEYLLEGENPKLEGLIYYDNRGVDLDSLPHPCKIKVFNWDLNNSKEVLIGDVYIAIELLRRKITEPLLRDPSDNTCTIGLSRKDGKWYGWGPEDIEGFNSKEEAILFARTVN
jgi:hypothetical protein